MGLIGCPETSVRYYRFNLCIIPEERRFRPYRGGSLKPFSVILYNISWLSCVLDCLMFLKILFSVFCFALRCEMNLWG